MNRIGLALGGGGARGFAHIRFLEVLDELRVRPSVVAGCSMGAVVGALYASGQSAAEIRRLIERYAPSESGALRESWHTVVAILKSLMKLKFEFRRSGLVKIDGLLERLLEPLVGKTFDDLEVPLVVVATDFWRAEETVLDSGDLLAAIRASISIPGLISPQMMNDRVLVDGGLVNELPFEHLRDRCDTTIAISVAGTRDPDSRQMPSSLEASAGAIDILQETVLRQKLARTSPDVLVCPDIRNIELLDFAKVHEVFAQCEPSVAEFRSDIRSLVEGRVS